MVLCPPPLELSGSRAKTLNYADPLDADPIDVCMKNFRDRKYINFMCLKSIKLIVFKTLKTEFKPHGVSNTTELPNTASLTTILSRKNWNVKM